MEIQRMMIKRCLSFIGLALAMCLGSFGAYAAERVDHVASFVLGDSQSFAAQSVKHDLTLAQWRTGSDTGSSHIKSNLIALSNHFGMTSAVPMATPDWPATINV
jgi:hypothetical protein